MLLDAVFTLDAAGAAAIWRRIEIPSGTATWRSILERGACENLPSPSLVEAILEGALSTDCLPAHRAVLRAGSDASGIALVLADVHDPEERLDALEALLHVRRALSGAGIPLSDIELPPRPRPRDEANE